MNVFKELSRKDKLEMAIQLVIMDAIEKGLNDKALLIAYMETEGFSESVEGYVKLMEE